MNGKMRLTLLACGVLTLALVLPAAGAPSIGDVADKAAKALRIAKGAKRTAKNARSAADDALRGPRVVFLDQERAAPPFDFAEFELTCPSGMQAVGVSMGVGALEPVIWASAGPTALASAFNPSSDTTYNGTLYVRCVEGLFASASAFGSREELADAVARAERQKLAAD
jgi:hypothetical protein